MISCCVFLLTVFVNMTAAITSLCFRYCIYLIKQTDTLHSILCLAQLYRIMTLTYVHTNIPFLYSKLDYIPVFLFCSNLTTQTASSTMRHVFLFFPLFSFSSSSSSISSISLLVCSFIHPFVHSFVHSFIGIPF